MFRLATFFLMVNATTLMGQSAWINELHYDDIGTDSLEFVEVMRDSALTDVRLYLYNGATGVPYDSVLTDTLNHNSYNGFLLSVWYPHFIQNGPDDGICVMSGTEVIQALSYEGTFTGTGGPAAGIHFQNLPVSESTYTPENHSLQLYGIGDRYPHFSWQLSDPASPGWLNNGQVLESQPVIYYEIADSLIFDTTPYGFSSGSQSFILRASNIQDALRVYPPPGFEVDTSEYFQTRAVYGSYLILPVTEDDYVRPAEIYVRFTPSQPDGLLHSEVIRINEPAAPEIMINVQGQEGHIGLPRMWINEFHYDNISYDTLEFIEIAVQHADRYLADDIHLNLYNGNTGSAYKHYTLSEAWQSDYDDPSWDLFVVDVPLIQNGPDGMALCYQDSCTQFISYEGTFSAKDGPAYGQTSRQIGPEEMPDTPPLSSLQLMGLGKYESDFSWILVPGGHTMGYPNTSQVLPLRLVNYSVKQDGNEIIISWITAGESKNAGFRAGISYNGKSYDSIGWVEGSNRSTASYSFRYTNKGNHYLRMTQIDTDGLEIALFVIRISDTSEIKWEVSASGVLFHPYSTETNARINLYSSTGQLIATLIEPLDSNRTDLSHWLQDLPSGTYLLHIQTAFDYETIRLPR